MKVYVFLQVLRDLISISLLLLICNCVYSQNKYEINWVFGMNAGINFNDTSNPAAFKTFSNNNETNASVSNRDGELLFYISFKGSFPAGNPVFKILDSQGSLITNGDSLKSLGTCTNGVAIIPFSVDSDKFHIFHIGKIFFDGCGFPCYYLYYSIVQRQSNNEFEVISKNNLLMQHRIAERMALTKHSNGKDWWLAVTETENAISLPCTNKYYKFLIKNDSINGPFDQSIGAIQCNSASYIGEMTFSRSGSLLAVAKSGGGVHLMNFDRCDGLFYNYRHVDSSQAWFYGCEFSSNERFLYASEAKLGENLYQYDLHSPDIQGSKQLILSNSDTNLIIGQLQIAPDNKIYVGFDFGVSTPHYNTLKNYLIVINEPNLPGL